MGSISNHITPVGGSMFADDLAVVRSVLSQQDRVSETFPSSTDSSSSSDATRRHVRPPASPPESFPHPDLSEGNDSGTPTLYHSQDPVSTNDNGHPTPISDPLPDSRVSQLLEGLDDLSTPHPRFLEHVILCDQPTLNGLIAPAVGTLTVHPSDTTAVSPSSDDATLSKTPLATCTDITFSATLRRILEDCKTDRGLFLRKVEESKAALPNGQGWKAAIAIKQENADMRDLLSIYHRFECYNIYRHVVEDGFHTGDHWIRDRRQELAKKLCDDFPERFQTFKAANKSLNWVDQGCRYHEWTKMFSQASELGFLVALPSEIPRSAYTSRCTKDQMSATAVRFLALGICEIVKDLELSQLGNHIAQGLKEMTSRNHTQANGLEDHVQDYWKSPRLMSSIDTSAIVQADQSTTPHGAVAICEDIAMLDDDMFLSASMILDDDSSNCQLSPSTYLDFFMDNHFSNFTLPIDHWLQQPSQTESQVTN